MAGGIDLEIQGIEEITKAFEALKSGISQRALLDLNREAGKIVKKRLQGNAPSRRLRKASSIAISKRGRTTVGVGYRRAFYIARFYERGARNRRTRLGYNRGDFRARPFITRTYHDAIPDVVRFVNNNAQKIIRRSLERHSSRLSKRISKLKA
jgi:HK97 gp10 family phage protein